MAQDFSLPELKNTRFPAISACRCIAMVFIVLCHFLQYYANELAWWFNVGVQMFLFISGFLYGSKPITAPMAFLTRNFKKILIPYYCFLLPAVIVYCVFAREHLQVWAVISAFMCVGTIEGIGHLWFVGYILLCYLLTPLLAALVKRWQHRKWSSFLCLCCLTVILGQACSLVLGSAFTFSHVACYLFGYFAAVFLQRYGSRLFHLAVYFVIGLSVAANGIRIVFRYIIPVDIVGFGLFEQYAHVLLGAALVLALLLILRNIRENAVLRLTEKYSYYVYTVHQLFILSPFSLLAVTKFAPLNWLLAILAICAAAAALRYVSGKASLGLGALEKAIQKRG